MGEISIIFLALSMLVINRNLCKLSERLKMLEEENKKNPSNRHSEGGNLD